MNTAEKIADSEATVAQDYDDYNAAGRIWGQVPRERIKKIRFPRVPKATVDRYLSLADMTGPFGLDWDDFVAHMAGGIKAWLAENGPVEK